MGLRSFFRSIGRSAFAKAGGSFYASGARIIRIKNNRRRSEGLTAPQKARLRPVFGGLVNSVRVTYKAKLLEPVTIGTKKIGVRASAQTFGSRIYVRSSSATTHLLAHEMQHVLQNKRAGSLRKFGERYFRAYWDAGFSYKNNRMEVEARKVANAV